MAEGGAPSTVDAEISNAWATVDGMIDWAVAFLPKLAIGVVVFVLFWLIGKGVRAGVRRAMADRPGTRGTWHGKSRNGSRCNRRGQCAS